MSEKFRYYVVGMGMIFVVLLNVIISFGFSIYSTVCTLKQKWREHKEKKANKLAKSPNTEIKIDDSQQAIADQPAVDLRVNERDSSINKKKRIATRKRIVAVSGTEGNKIRDFGDKKQLEAKKIREFRDKTHLEDSAKKRNRVEAIDAHDIFQVKDAEPIRVQQISKAKRGVVPKKKKGISIARNRTPKIFQNGGRLLDKAVEKSLKQKTGATEDMKSTPGRLSDDRRSF